jgi:hypothetical protein
MPSPLAMSTHFCLLLKPDVKTTPTSFSSLFDKIRNALFLELSKKGTVGLSKKKGYAILQRICFEISKGVFLWIGV